MTLDPGQPSDGGANGEEPEMHSLVLPAEGVEDLTDQLTQYMTEIELGGLTDIMGQVLDDFLDQCGGMPEDLADTRAFEQITGGPVGRHPRLPGGTIGRPVAPDCQHAGAPGRRKMAGPDAGTLARHFGCRLPEPQGVGISPPAPNAILRTRTR